MRKKGHAAQCEIWAEGRKREDMDTFILNMAVGNGAGRDGGREGGARRRRKEAADSLRGFYTLVLRIPAGCLFLF